MSTHALIHKTTRAYHHTVPGWYQPTQADTDANLEVIELHPDVVNRHSLGIATLEKISVPIAISSGQVRSTSGSLWYGYSRAQGPDANWPKAGSATESGKSGVAPPAAFRAQFIAAYTAAGADRFRFTADTPGVDKLVVGGTEYQLAQGVDNADADVNNNWDEVDYDEYSVAATESNRTPLNFGSTSKTVSGIQFLDDDGDPMSFREGRVASVARNSATSPNAQLVAFRRARILPQLSAHLIHEPPFSAMYNTAIGQGNFHANKLRTYDRYLHKLWVSLTAIDTILADNHAYSQIQRLLSLDVLGWLSSSINEQVFREGNNWTGPLADSDRIAYIIKRNGSVTITEITEITEVIEDTAGESIQIPADWHNLNKYPVRWRFPVNV